MQSTLVAHALNRLRAAADKAYSGFPPTEWSRVSGPGPEKIGLDGGGGFAGLALEPGTPLVLRCRLDVPAEQLGVQLAGDELAGALFSLYPCDIVWNGKPIFADDLPPVAAGPCLFTIVPELAVGDNGIVELTIRPPSNQMTAWFNLRLTTPGLRARFEALDVAWAQLALADTLAVDAEERAMVTRAAEAVPDPLPTESAALCAVLARLSEAVRPLDRRAKSIRVHLVGHSHIDMNWLWTMSDTEQVIIRDLKSVLGLMDEFPELTFSHSQPATYEIFRRREPALFDRVVEHIRAGRWEPIAMQWVEGDVNMASGEAAARQMLEAVTYSQQELGFEPTTFHCPDTFGHAGNLPQLAVSAGAERYYHHRCNPGGANQWPVYWWEGQDGTRVLGVSTPSYNGEIHARDLAHAAITAYRHGLPCGLHYHGIGDHGGGPSRQNLQALRRFQTAAGLPTASCSTMAAYTKEIIDSGARLPEHRGESSTIFEGCYTTHADTKLYNRAGENALCTADSLAAVAGLPHRDELVAAWRNVLFNQFHDIFDGSAIHEVYERNRADFEEARASADAVTSDALAVLEAYVASGSVAVTNPLGWEREDWVTVPGLMGEGAVRLVADDGHVATGQYTDSGLGFVARAPAFGTVGYRVDGPSMAHEAVQALPAFAPVEDRLATPEQAESAPYLRIETLAYRAYVRRDCGIIVGLYDKRASRELVSFGSRRPSDYMDTARPDLALNVFQVTEELPHAMTAWEIHEVASEHSLLRGAKTKVVETGPARCVVEVTHHVRASTIRQRIVFYQQLPRIDFEADIDWQEVGSGEAGVPGLKAAFTARLSECEAWFETPFAAVKRPSDGQESPALRWADVGGDGYGISVLNDSKHGYDALGCRLRLSLLRSAYDPDAISDQGRHSVRYALLPHRASWRDAGVVRAAAAFNQPLIARVSAGTPVAAETTIVRPRVSGDGSVIVACVKRARHGSGLIIRLYESAGRATDARLVGLPPDAAACETSIVERRLRPLDARDGGVSLTFRPWQVRTVLVE